MLGIFYASFTKQEHFDFSYHFFEGEDKVVHFIMYFGLMALLTLSFRLEKNFLKKFVTILIFGIVLAVMTEIIQSYIPGRDASWGDLIANLIGLFAGYFAVNAYLARKKSF